MKKYERLPSFSFVAEISIHAKSRKTILLLVVAKVKEKLKYVW